MSNDIVKSQEQGGGFSNFLEGDIELLMNTKFNHT